MSEAMTCGAARAQLGALLDGEIPSTETVAVTNHLASCASCRREHEALRVVQAGIRTQLPMSTAPDVLRARVVAPIRTDPGRRPSVQPGRASWTRRIAAGLVIAIASSATTYSIVRQSGGDPAGATSDVVAAHVRSLMTSHLTDVTSTDEHNVKPWFDGKVAFAPNVPRLDSVGYQLIGGRIDTVGRSSVAAIVYGRRKHLINLFTWPAFARSGAGDTITGTTERGYNLLRWNSGDMQYAAVSDLAMDELRRFVAAYSSLPSLIPSNRTVDR